MTDRTARQLKVLVPDELGEETLSHSPGLQAVRYVAGDPWPAEHADSTAVVVGLENWAEVGARFAELPHLRLIQTLNAGYEQWLPYLPDGVMLSNGRGAHGGSCAEWAVAALLAIYRDLSLFREQQERGEWTPTTTETLIGKRVLVLGAGDLALSLASRLAPFEVDVTLYGRSARAGVLALDDIDELLPTADAVVNMLPENSSTHRLVDGDFLARLRDGAIVVNAGRGGTLDTDALLQELTAGRLRAALDVTDPEPLPAGHPLWSAPGLILTPHISGLTEGVWQRSWNIARHQLDVYARGERPTNLVAGPN
ncbi:2-hydroxyacid dehydrogenase [Rhodococcus sp. IEGM 1354]|uniref:2-hydroxyacid dehydrogenase n=1 Tax=Rhodococcus sp. IEGM 1354 TaxID=3047088 RepID=UPI0024B6CAFE|nr:2-hydroxyacid dehydrogenase [Rhodococcus sp. IEGM 1354]MDI9933212.1 2-hydroxyacid dehydrogenase [Rhodococcus sp. IEGM 1354]